MNYRKFGFINDDKYFYDEEIIYNTILKETENKDMLLQQYDKERQQVMGCNILNKLTDLRTGFGFDKEYDNLLITKLIQSLPFKIYPNLVEWINEEELTEIKIKDISLKELVKYVDLETCENKSLYNYLFYKLLVIIGDYNNNKYEDKNQVLRISIDNTYYK